jgi:hypothetical protein
MGNTTICFRDREFVANDCLIEIWMLEVSRQVGNDAQVEEWLVNLRDEWKLQAAAGFGFGPSPALDDFITTDERRQRMTDYFHKALESLSRRDRDFTPDELSRNSVGGDVHYSQPVPTQMVIDVGNSFLDLMS